MIKTLARSAAALLAIALMLVTAMMSAQPAAAADPDWETFPRAQRTTVSPEEVVFSPTQTGNVRVTITTRFTESADWTYKSLRISSGYTNFYLDRNEVVGNLREVVVSGDVTINQARGYNWVNIIPGYTWKDAPSTLYESGAYSYFPVHGKARVTLQGPARITPGTSLTLTGKLDCFLRTNYAVPSGDYSSIEIQFREEGGDWVSMGYAAHNRDTGTFRYYNIAVGATGDWRALSSSNTCTNGTSSVLRVVAGNDDPPPPPVISNAPAMSVISKTHNTVTLDWAKPTRPGGTITGYRWGWTSANGLPQKTWDWVFPNPPDPFVMTNLAPENEYTMWVEAITAAGTGERTTLSVTTNAAPTPRPVPIIKPPTAPRALKVSSSSTSAKLYWAAPASNGGAAINAYQVKRSGNAAVTTTGAATRSYTFGKLRTLTRYTAYVRAHNVKGWGPWAGTAFYTKAPAPKAYSSCAKLNYDYPHGVGKSGAVDRGTRITTFYRSNTAYAMNDGRVRSKHQYDLDRDNDGIACER